MSENFMWVEQKFHKPALPFNLDAVKLVLLNSYRREGGEGGLKGWTSSENLIENG